MKEYIFSEAAAKTFNIVHNIPVFGTPLRLASWVIVKTFAKVKDDDELNEFSKRLGVNPLALIKHNPIKSKANIARHLLALTKSYEKGIWIGKRMLSSSPIGLSLVPCLDIYHWAIMINGTIYQVIVPNVKNGSLDVEITTEESTQSSFIWHLVKRHCCKTKDDLETFVNEYKQKKSYKIIAIRDCESNCQKFVLHMLEYAGDKSRLNAVATISFYAGTTLF